MSTPQLQRLHGHCHRLRLYRVEAELTTLLEQAAKRDLGYADFLDELLALEVRAKAEKHLAMRTAMARFPFHKGFGHFVNTASTVGHKTVPNQAVYSGTKFAVRAISEGLRQEAGDKLRVTIISPGFVQTNFADGVTNPEVKAQLAAARDKFAMPPAAIARAIAFAIEQPADIDVNEIVVRPTAQA